MCTKMSLQPLDPLDLEIYHINPKGEKKQIKLGEVNRPPTPSIVEKPQEWGCNNMQQYYRKITQFLREIVGEQ